MLNKRVASAAEAIAGVKDGDVLLVGGFGTSGRPAELLWAIYETGASDLVIVANNTTTGSDVIAALLKAGRIRKFICSFPRGLYGHCIIDDLYRTGKIEIELVPQGTLAERIRAGAAGIAGFYTPTAVGTDLAKGKEVREFNGRAYVLETPIYGDMALIRGKRGDTFGNLVYHRGARINNPVMAGAARITVAQVEEIVHPGELDPEHIITPGIFVDRLVEVKCQRD